MPGLEGGMSDFMTTHQMIEEIEETSRTWQPLSLPVRNKIAKRLDELERENARLRVTPQRLADALVAAGVIDLRAIEDREGHDNYQTWDAVIRAAIILSNAEVSDRRAHTTEIKQDADGGSLH
jgi:hypothetical protein